MHARFSSLLSMILLGTLVSAHGTSRRHRVVRSAKTYALQDLYEGLDFFSGWSFYEGEDPTGGNVNYVSEEDATAQHLAYVNTDGTVVLAVDSTSKVQPGGKRNSVRITSNNVYNGGLFILDAAAMPVGCGTWPAFWTFGPDWPLNGEIDIVEGINDQTNNQMTLHSGTETCTLNKNSDGQFTGQVINTQCYSTSSSDAGCSIRDTATNSFGPGFNAAKGGVFAFLWDTQAGMSMWHFARSNVPQDISNKMPTPSNWGEPAGFWSADTCKISDNFKDHQMVFDITICGSWAGSSYSQSGCPGKCSDIVANAANFANAKWVINSVAVYQPSSSLLPIQPLY